MGALTNQFQAGLTLLFYLGLAWFLLTLGWHTGWTMFGDPYALGPYRPWLSVSLPIATLGLWTAFFSAWALGALRRIHLSRWFYLLLLSALLMVNVLFSVQSEASLAVLSLYLSAWLWLSVSFQRLQANLYFWGWYGACVGLNLGLYLIYPPLVDPLILGLMAWLGALHAWWQWSGGLPRSFLSLATLGLVMSLRLDPAVIVLVAVSWIWLWATEYQAYRRKNFAAFAGVLVGLGLMLGVWWSQQNLAWSWQTLKPLGASFDLLTGVGLGQLGWAQYLAQNDFTTLTNINPNIWGLRIWWYELGLLNLLWWPALWLLCLGQSKNFGFRTALFVGIMLLVPTLWLSPSGILLLGFWWFNRGAWERISE